MRELYPEIEPYQIHRLPVDTVHTLYIEEVGKPDGIPVVFLHGGPGGGISARARRLFDPARFRVILFDQRGAGKSTPHADLRDNTTWHLVADIEAIRAYMGIERWIVFGGSWGATLALAYAQTHPEPVLQLVLRGVFLGRDEEVRWLNEMDGGAAWIFPERWAAYRDHIPPAERGNMVEAYWQRLSSDDAAVRLAAALAWGNWEGGSTTLKHDPTEASVFGSDHTAVSVARAEVHYFRHKMFLQPSQLLRDVARIRHIPATIVQGRYDMICPVKSAYELSLAWPEAQLHVVQAGHSMTDPATLELLMSTMDKLGATTQSAVQ